MENDETNLSEPKLQSAEASPTLNHELNPFHVINDDYAGTDNSEVAMPALFGSLIAAPLQIEDTKTEVPIYSNYLTSRIIAIEVGEEKTYHLHSSLLCRESRLFKKSLNGDLQEAKQLKVDLIDESPDEFSHFVDFLYIPSWKPACQSGDDVVFLVNLFAMGERLVAQGFQDSILRSFIDNITTWTLERPQLCQLLTIACRNINERFNPSDDPKRDHIFWLAASKLSELRRSEDFRLLLGEQDELGKQLCLRAGNGTTQKPPDPFITRQKEGLNTRGSKKTDFALRAAGQQGRSQR